MKTNLPSQMMGQGAQRPGRRPAAVTAGAEGGREESGRSGDQSSRQRPEQQGLRGRRQQWLLAGQVEGRRGRVEWKNY